MLTDASMKQTVKKLERFCKTLYSRIFLPIGQAEITGCYQTREPLSEIPPREAFDPVPETWGGEGMYGWFQMRYTVPEEAEGKALFLRPTLGFYEGTLWVNGRIHSNYANKILENSHGNHWCNRFTDAARAGESYEFDLECYAWHADPGNHPLEHLQAESYEYPVRPVLVCTRDDGAMDFLFDLETLLSLRRGLPETSFRRAEVENALYEAHLRLMYDPEACTEEEFRRGLREAAPFLKESLAKRNGDVAPYMGLIGHSHMDTAWLWPLTETEKKCARTYANQLNLMEEYPEYRFIQSSAFHADWLRRDYPELFSRIQQAVQEGKWEPNGGVWVECDCNLTGGEYMIRQFLWGQRFTRKYFGYTSDCFWLPDTFGYSFAIPQIMRGCGLKYFLTTKLSWNDTNEFPLTTFLWQGLDGSTVLTHFNRTHQGPSPEMYQRETEEAIREKRVSGMRLFSFGKGDGGGGPEFEMLERARRLEDLQGAARSGYTTVSDFMRRLEETARRPTTYAGELYLELHRGTLTNQHEIKRNNRKCEIALRNAELALTWMAVRRGHPADESPVAPMMNTLLVHQFHDLLPGTCIHAAHVEARAAVSGAIGEAEELIQKTLAETPSGVPVLYHPLSFPLREKITLPGDFGRLEGCETQVYTSLEGTKQTAVYGLALQPLSGTPLRKAANKGRVSPEDLSGKEGILANGLKVKGNLPDDIAGRRNNSSAFVPGMGDEATTALSNHGAASVFRLEGNHLQTPFADIEFSENGAIASMMDRRTGRELVAGLPFNTFLMVEDVPALWDNWDIDADAEEKFIPAGKLISREVISCGPVELRIRGAWRLSERSVIRQDMVFDAHSPMITFETEMDWQEDHRFLKAAFDTTLHTDFVRNEIQFGHIRRSVHRSTEVEKARFEICQHKFSDLSEAGYGIALLNDGKYGLSVREGSMRLSLHKGGLRPDDQGDHGMHRTRYAILPHAGGFSAETVVWPAYAFNNPPFLVRGGASLPSLCRLDTAQVIIEAVKPCEDTARAYLLRLYECEGGSTETHLTFSHPVKAMQRCNMLEEIQEELQPGEPLRFTPFQIQTIRVEY